jgi:hypothetical protein
MKIQPTFQNINELLERRLFQIPDYQRAYSWEKKQRGDLFNDISRVKSSGDDHFLATIVGLTRGKVQIIADEFTKVDLVDGQQRLTTLILLFNAIARALRPEDDTEAKLAVDIKSLLVKQDALRLLLLQTNHDSSHIFTDYLREGIHPDRNSIEITADKNLLDAIEECEQFVVTWNEAGHSLIDLLRIIRNRLWVIFHEVDDEGLVYRVFEVLNSRGLDVTWLDKLKSQLMALIFENASKTAKDGIISELHHLWRDIYHNLGLRKTLGQETIRFAGTLKSNDMPRRPIDEASSVQILVEQCGTSTKKVVECTKWILNIVQAESKILNDPRLGGVTLVIQARLVAVAILLRRFSKEDEKELLKSWEKITFRYFGLHGNDARSGVGDFVKLAWRITNEGLAPAEIFSELARIGAEYPFQLDFKALSRENFYQGWTQELRYFFYRYEEYLAEKKGQRLNQSQWSRIWAEDPSKSIEHIHAQSRGSDNPKTSGIYIHRLGNLMMLPPGVNSKLQDITPAKKANEYSSCGLLAAIEVSKLLGKGKKWNRVAVDKRERKLLQWAAHEWGD